MGRRRKNHGGSRLASDQIPGQNQNNSCLRPCHSLWYHHQAFRDDTQFTLYSLAPSNASDNTSRANLNPNTMCRSIPLTLSVHGCVWRCIRYIRE